MSWEQVRDERAQCLFKLAAYFPEAIPIPLWLLGLAAGLGESCLILNPLWEARTRLQKVSLMEVLIGDQVRLHPLVRAFGQHLVIKAGEQGKALLEAAGKRLVTTCTDLNTLEQRARHKGYWTCLEQVYTTRQYLEQIAPTQAETMAPIGRWLSHESCLLGNSQWWPEPLPALFCQQLFNRSVEEGSPLSNAERALPWLKLAVPAGVEDRLLQIFAGHTGAVRSVAFSPDGTRVLTGSSDHTARLWESSTGRLLSILEGHMGDVNSAVFSPDGTRVLTGSNDHTARLWESSTGRLLSTLKGHTNWVRSVAFSPDGTRVLTGSDDHTARLWESSTGRLLSILEGHKDPVSSVAISPAISPDGTRVLTGDWDGTARLWESSTGRRLSTLKGHTNWVRSVAFSPDGTRVLTGSDDHTARLWESSTGRLLSILEGHKDPVSSVAFSPDGTRVLTSAWDQTARLWESSTGRCLSTLKGHTDKVDSVAFSPDGKLIITCDKGRVLFWSAREPKPGRMLGMYVATYYMVGTVYWQDTTHLVLADTGGSQGRPRFYRLELEGNWRGD